MKEQMTYIAVDADDVGESVGGAVLSNDTKQLSEISQKINAGVQIFAKWAEYNGGSIISSGSDEGIFQVPVSSIDELEELKQQYEKQTGFSISIGVGDTVSSAAKALIYAKMNGKNQIVDYSPEIEEVMKQSMGGNLEEKEKTSENKLPGGVGDNTDPKSLDQEELEEGKEEEKEHTNDEEVAEEIATDHLSEDPEFYEKESEEESSDEEPVTEEENEEPSEDLDNDGLDDKEESHGKITEEDDIDEDGEVDHEEAMISRAASKEKYKQKEENTDEDLSQALEAEMEGNPSDEEAIADEIVAEEETPAEESTEEASNQETPVLEEESEEENTDEEPVVEEENTDEESFNDETLKQAIFESLQIFKQNRDLLNALSTENPDLYNALITSLQSMIEMAKELGYGGYGESMEEFDEMNPDDYLVQEESSDEEPVTEDTESEEESSDEEPVAEEENTDEEKESSEKEDKFKKNEELINFFSRMNEIMGSVKLLKDEDNDEKKKEMLKKFKERLKQKLKSKLVKKPASSKPSKDKAKKVDLSKFKKKKKPTPKADEGSFCATSHRKMIQSGKDCRSNEDKDSPVCAARKKYNCRGKNEEKGPVMQKAEKLKDFLSKKRKK